MRCGVIETIKAVESMLPYIEDLDAIIKQFEYFFEMDRRTLSNPVSEDGHLFDTTYPIYKEIKW